MAKIKLNGDTSGYIEISAPAVSGNNTLELGPGTKILTNLDNTFTGITTFSNGIHITSGGFILNQQRSDTHASLIIDKPDAGTGTLKFFNNGSASAYIQHTNSEHLNYYLPSGSGSQVFYTNGTERLRVTSGGDLAVGSTGDVYGPARLNIRPDNRQTQFSASDGNTWHDVVIKQNDTNASGGNAVGLAFEISTGGWHANAGTGIAAIKDSNSTDYGSHLAFITRPHAAVAEERVRITSDGHLSYKNSSPPAWSTDSGYANATLGSSAYFRTDTDVNSNFFTIGSNAYRSSSGWQHVNSGWATQLQQSANDGDLSYRSSSTSGSAGGTITWVEHFRATSAGNFGIGENSPADRLVVQKANASGDVAARIKNDTTTDGSASNPTTASLYLTTSTGDFNTFYIQARRNDNDTHFGYSNPRDGGHTPNMIISNEGRITKPLQPAFSVRRNGNQSIAHNTFTKVQWNTEIFDVGGHFDRSTNFRFTAPVAGKYLFLGHLYVYSTYQVEAYVYKNGGAYKRFSGPVGTGGNDNPNGMDFMDIVHLSVNDYVEIFAYHVRIGDTNTVDIYGGNNKETSFVGYLLG